MGHLDLEGTRAYMREAPDDHEKGWQPNWEASASNAARWGSASAKSLPRAGKSQTAFRFVSHGQVTARRRGLRGGQRSERV